MVEFVIVFLLARYNGNVVRAKGYSAGAYQWGTAGLWFGGEILAGIIGALVLPRHQSNSFAMVYVFALGGAILGGAIAWLIAKTAEPRRLPFPATHRAPAQGMPAWPQPDPRFAPAMIPGGTEFVVLQQYGDWTMVQAANGFVAWVDGRSLVARPPADTPWRDSPIG